MKIDSKLINQTKKEALDEIPIHFTKFTKGNVVNFKDWGEFSKWDRGKAQIIEGAIDIFIRHLRSKLKASK